MRGTCARTLAELATRDERVMLLTGDLGFMALEPFSDAHSDRFLNMGVAEQNMVGVATGLAEAGYIPFCYSIVTFASLRPYEFIRNGPALHRLPVRIMGVGGGFEYGHAGPTHFGLEDIGVMRVQPHITVVAPADAEQARAALEATWDLPGPVYYRLGKDDRARVPGLDGRFELGRLQVVRDGADACILAMGPIAGDAVEAAQRLADEHGIEATVAVVASITPAPIGDLAALLPKFEHVVTVEAHYVSGGLGSLVAEVIAEHGTGTRLTRHAVAAGPDGRSGSQRTLQHRHGLDADAIVQTMLAHAGVVTA